MKHILSQKSKSTLTNVRDEDSQPNAVDLRVAKVFHIYDSAFVLSVDNSKIHRKTIELQPSDKGYWQLAPGAYEIVMENEIAIGKKEAGWIVARSTLIRNGVFIVSGVYDTGYNGAVGGCLHVTTGQFILEKGSRVGQFLLFDAEMLSEYQGSYGKNSEHDKKYA